MPILYLVTNVWCLCVCVRACVSITLVNSFFISEPHFSRALATDNNLPLLIEVYGGVSQLGKHIQLQVVYA